MSSIEYRARRSTAGLALAAWCFVAGVGFAGQAQVVDGVTIRAHRVEDLVLDGQLTEDIYRSVEPSSGFIQKEPEDGQPATQRTDVYFGYDEQAIHFVFVAHDTEPDRIRAHMNRREKIRGDDLVEPMLDPFGDEQRAPLSETPYLNSR